MPATDSRPLRPETRVTGVCPRGAQVRALCGLSACPASSSKQIRAPVSAASLVPWPRSPTARPRSRPRPARRRDAPGPARRIRGGAAETTRRAARGTRRTAARSARQPGPGSAAGPAPSRKRPRAATGKPTSCSPAATWRSAWRQCPARTSPRPAAAPARGGTGPERSALCVPHDTGLNPAPPRGHAGAPTMTNQTKTPAFNSFVFQPAEVPGTTASPGRTWQVHPAAPSPGVGSCEMPGRLPAICPRR